MPNYAYANPGKQHLGYRFNGPPILGRYDKENEQLLGIKFKTATIVNRRAYVGNVQITYYDGREELYPDAIFKSDPNKLDLFRQKSKVEASINDGESINALSSFGDRILEFKNNTLNIINVAGELENLEASHKYLGTHSDHSVIKTDYGVMWIGAMGIYLYNGQGIRNLIENNGKAVLNGTFNNFKSKRGAKSSLVFDPEKRQLIVFRAIGNASASYNDVLLYDFRQNAWSNGTNVLTANDRQKPVTYLDNVYIPADITGLKLFKWNPVSPAAADNLGDFHLKTKDYDFGSPGVRKRIYKVYITYTSGSTSGATNIQAQYYINGDTSSAKEFKVVSNATLDSAITEIDPPGIADEWDVCILKPAVGSDASNIYSFQLALFVDTGQTRRFDFKINDITIIYRTKNPK